jgi:ribosomal protein S2
MGIVDTDTKSHNVSLAIPGNDDSLSSIIFYNTIIAELVLFYKFFYLVL